MVVTLTLNDANLDALRAAIFAYDAALLDAMGKMRAAGLPDACDALRDGPRAALLALMQTVDDAPKDDAPGTPMRAFCPDCGYALARLPAIGHGRAVWGCLACNPDLARR